MPDLHTLLADAQTIAVVGCSPDPSRTSHAIARYLQSAGYRIVPINPTCDECLGETAYPDLQSVPEDLEIDIVNIFRNARYAANMVQMAVDYAEATQTKPAIWTQLGVSTLEAQKLADDADLPYVKNRCIMVEHRQVLR